MKELGDMFLYIYMYIKNSWAGGGSSKKKKITAKVKSNGDTN